MQPHSGSDTRGVILSTYVSKAQIPANTKDFCQRKMKDVAVDEVFFTKCFNEIASNKSAFRKKKVRNARKDDGDEEDEGDSEAKSEIRRAMVGSRPDIKEGDVGFDDGDDIAGLSDISDDSHEGIQDCGGG